jgi:hypothetical protein
MPQGTIENAASWSTAVVRKQNTTLGVRDVMQDLCPVIARYYMNSFVVLLDQ